ncbi:MAG: glucose 1-dehydrogenase [Clostridia bacterium]|nr:glucose 1-dehydrogenase [Clostridia bacterium]
MKKKKVVLITGASRGIGAEMAKRFAENGYSVVIDYNESQEKAMQVLKEITDNGGDAIAVKADMRVPVEVENLFNTAIKTFGHIDVLINNAAVALGKLLIDTTLEDFENVFNTNIRGYFLMTKQVIPHFLSNGGGKIINISSVWGQTGGALETVYSASKGAIISFTKAVAKEYALSNITVNTISPGVIDTDMIRIYSDDEIDSLRQMIPVEKIAHPVEIANMALFLASDKANYITGQVLAVNGGFYI